MPEYEWDCVRKEERVMDASHTTIGHVFFM